MVSEAVLIHHGSPPLVTEEEYGPRPNNVRSGRACTLLVGFSQDPSVEFAAESEPR